MVSTKIASQFLLVAVVGIAACSGQGTEDGDGGDGGNGGETSRGGDGGGEGMQPGGAGGESSPGGHAGQGDQGGEGGEGGPGGQGGEPTNNNGGTAGTPVNSGGSGGTMQGGGSGGSMQTGGAQSSVPCSQRAYCNDFEDASDGSTPSGSEVDGGSSIKVATDRAFSGTKSLKVVGKVGGGQARFKVNLASKLKNPKSISYMRMMIYMPERPAPASGNAHWDVFSMVGNSSRGNTPVGFGGDQIASVHTARWLYLAGADCLNRGAPGIPLQKWACVEVAIDAEKSTPYSVSFDGAVQAGLTFAAADGSEVCQGSSVPWAVPKVETYYWGWKHWHTLPKDVTFWIDDIVVDQVPIGCPK